MKYTEKDEKKISDFLRNSIKKAETYLKSNNIDLKYSGSTLHLIMILKKRIYIVNLGNSWSVLYREIDEEKYAIELSNDHVLENKEERFRIYKNGGVVE